MTFSFLARGVEFVERGLGCDFLGVESWESASERVVKEVEDVLVVEEMEPPRGGTGGRAPDSTSLRSLAASRLMMRKRPSMAS